MESVPGIAMLDSNEQFSSRIPIRRTPVATQWIGIAKLTGESAAAISSLFKRWSDERAGSPDEPTLVEPEQWPVTSRRAMVRLADELRNHATEPPVVFYSEHVDMWSMGDAYREAFPENGGPLHEVEADDGVCLWCYELPDGGAMEKHIKRQLRRKRQPDETKVFLQGLLHAERAWRELVPQSCIVVVRRVTGGLVEDGNVAESSRHVADWMRSLLGKLE